MVEYPPSFERFHLIRCLAFLIWMLCGDGYQRRGRPSKTFLAAKPKEYFAQGASRVEVPRISSGGS